MVSRVLYRPFDTEDFDAIALILQQLWHNNSDNDEYNRLEAACDLAYCLSSSTFSMDVAIHGKQRDLVVVRQRAALEQAVVGSDGCAHKREILGAGIGLQLTHLR